MAKTAQAIVAASEIGKVGCPDAAWPWSIGMRWGARRGLRDQIRLDLLAVLTELIHIRPEWRLGKTLASLATTVGRLDAVGVWDFEDDEALEAANTLIEQESEATTAVTEPVVSCIG